MTSNVARLAKVEEVASLRVLQHGPPGGGGGEGRGAFRNERPSLKKTTSFYFLTPPFSFQGFVEILERVTRSKSSLPRPHQALVSIDSV